MEGGFGLVATGYQPVAGEFSGAKLTEAMRKAFVPVFDEDGKEAIAALIIGSHVK